MLEAALGYAELGYPVFPCEPAEKMPHWCLPEAIPGVRKSGLYNATLDEDQIVRWWTDYPDACIGIRTDGLLVIDIDGRDNAWFKSLKEDQLDDLAAAPMTLTANGGRHYYFRQPAGSGLTISNDRRNKVDTRGNLGYAIAPPSRLTSGGVYRWSPGSDLGKRETLTETPGWFVDWLASNKSKPGERKEQALQSQPILEGSRNARLASEAGSLRRIGMSEGAIDAALQAINEERCQPPCDPAEVSRIAKSFAGYEPDPVASHRIDISGLKVNGVPLGSVASVKPRFNVITSAELDSGDYEVEYLIEGVLVKGQPLLLGGPPKSLKTSVLIEMGVSLAIGLPMFDQFEVLRPAKVLIMSGESGMATLQETATRVCRSKGITLSDAELLEWSDDLPRFGSADDMVALGELLTEREIEVLVIDPAYLCMPSADAGNLMSQGELLRAMSKACYDADATLCLAHHTKKNKDKLPTDALELSDLAWAGFAEFARQWLLINPREKYVPGTGKHAMWLSAGGSAGHSSLWAVDIFEGVRSPTSERVWLHELADGVEAADELSRERRNSKDTAKEQKRIKRDAEDRRAVIRAVFRFHDGLGRGETKSAISDSLAISHARGGNVLSDLVDEGLVEMKKITKGNRQTYDGYQLTAAGHGARKDLLGDDDLGSGLTQASLDYEGE